MIVSLVWFSRMTREGEIGMKSNAPGVGRGAEDFFTPLIRIPKQSPRASWVSWETVHWKRGRDESAHIDSWLYSVTSLSHFILYLASKYGKIKSTDAYPLISLHRNWFILKTLCRRGLKLNILESLLWAPLWFHISLVVTPHMIESSEHSGNAWKFPCQVSKFSYHATRDWFMTWICCSVIKRINRRWPKG
jgi:hypothetical protein